MNIADLVNIPGDLASSLGKIDISTWQSASQITTQMVSDPSLESFLGWTSDASLYRLVGDDVEFDFGGLGENPILKNIDEAIRQLKEDHNYFPPEDHIRQMVESPNTIKVTLSELPLEGNAYEWRYVEVSTVKFADGREAFLAEYGEKVTALFDKARGSDLYGEKGIGARLVSRGKQTTRFYVLNPDYIKEKLKSKPEGAAIVRASWLYSFDNNSDFGADGRGVDYANFSLRGVPLVGEADAQKITDYHELIPNPMMAKHAAEMLTPASAAALSNVLTMYLRAQEPTK